MVARHAYNTCFTPDVQSSWHLLLRIERDGVERRRSLLTRDPAQARAVAWRFGAKIHGMSKQAPEPLRIFPDAGVEELE